MPPRTPCPSTLMVSPHLTAAADAQDRGNLRISALDASSLPSRWLVGRPAPRILIRPELGFYVMRLASGAPLVAAVI